MKPALLALLVLASVAQQPAFPNDIPVASMRQADDARARIIRMLDRWRVAWELGDGDAYLACYEENFRGTEASHSAWARKRLSRLKEPDIEVRFGSLEWGASPTADESELAVRFLQIYRSARHTDTGLKEIVFRRQPNGDYRIARESWVTLP